MSHLFWLTDEHKWLVFSRTSSRAMVASALMIDAF